MTPGAFPLKPHFVRTDLTEAASDDAAEDASGVSGMPLRVAPLAPAPSPPVDPSVNPATRDPGTSYAEEGASDDEAASRKD
jgi:hypothetical protein